MVHHVVQARRHRLGQRTDFRETVGNELQALHVFVHLGNELVVGVVLFQNLGPRHEAGDGCAQLVGRLLGESHPHLVLLGTLRGEQGENGHDDEDEHHAQLHVGIEREALEHDGVVVADQLIRLAVGKVELDVVALVAQALAHPADIGQRVGSGIGLDFQVAVVVDVALAIEDNDGNGVVAFKHTEHQREVGVLVGLVEGMQGLGPHLHLVLLFLLQVAREEVGHDKRGHGDNDGSQHKIDFHLTYSVGPLHVSITFLSRHYCPAHRVFALFRNTNKALRQSYMAHIALLYGPYNKVKRPI